MSAFYNTNRRNWDEAGGIHTADTPVKCLVTLGIVEGAGNPRLPSDITGKNRRANELIGLLGTVVFRALPVSTSCSHLLSDQPSEEEFG